MKHILVFFAFRNTEDIKTSFDSLYLDTIDYFVVENKSEFSDEIEKYFSTKRLKGYIQFEKNIASNAMTIFVRDFFKFLSEYDIITLTDGDLYFYDIKSTLDEIISNLDYPKALVSSAALGIDQKRGALDAHHFLAVHVLLFQHVEGLGHFLVGVGEQGEGQLVPFLEALLCFGRIG